MEEFKGDKRTKEYKEWKARFDEENAKKSVGLGDTIEKVLEATGVSAVFKHLYGEDCGCDERKELLNDFGRRIAAKFKRRKVELLEYTEYLWLGDYFETNRSAKVMTLEDQINLIRINNRVFKDGMQITSCGECLVKLKKKMSDLYEEYKKIEIEKQRYESYKS